MKEKGNGARKEAESWELDTSKFNGLIGLQDPAPEKPAFPGGGVGGKRKNVSTCSHLPLVPLVKCLPEGLSFPCTLDCVCIHGALLPEEAPGQEVRGS